MPFNKLKWNRQDSERIGCDICKIKKPTERFEGYLHNVLWVCGFCYKNISLNSEKLKGDK